MRTLLKTAAGALLILLQTAPAATQREPGPRGSRPLYFGYYFADGRWGDATTTVWQYTNLYIAVPTAYDTALDWRPLFRKSMQRAFENGKAIMLVPGEDHKRRFPMTMDAVLTIAKPFWQNVVLIEVAHEEDLPPGGVEERIRAMRQTLDRHGLPHRPFGLIYTRDQALTAQGLVADGLNWVGIEAYVDPPAVNDAAACPTKPAIPAPGPDWVPTADCRGWVPQGHPLAQLPGSVSDLNQFLEQAKRRVPPDKQIVLVMMAYDRNGSWTNPDTLAALQRPVYLSAYADPRVTAVLMFNYARPGGTRDYPQLQMIHRQMGEEIGISRFDFRGGDRK